MVEVILSWGPRAPGSAPGHMALGGTSGIPGDKRDVAATRFSKLSWEQGGACRGGVMVKVGNAVSEVDQVWILGKPLRCLGSWLLGQSSLWSFWLKH